MRILLDTHVWLWMVSDPARLAPAARAALTSRDNALLLSAASVWEMAIKYQLGKLPLPQPPADFVPPRLVRDGVEPLAVEHHHAAYVATLPAHHRDPFDRLLAAQAVTERLVLCTADPALAAYPCERLPA